MEQQDPQLTVEQAIVNLQGDDLGKRVYAAWWLGRFRVDTREAIDVLVTALQDKDDRTNAGGYPLRRNAARALGKLGEQRVVPALVKALECSDFYVREAATQALEMLGDPGCIPRLIELLKNQIPGTQPAPEAPHLVQPFDAIIEALGTLGATDAVPLILPFLDHIVPRVQFAAVRAMYQLTPDPQEAEHYANILVQALSHDDLKVRRVTLADIGAIGYLPAAEAISQTLVANSLRLITLKKLLEKQLKFTTSPTLSPEAIKIMTFMDDLL